MKDQQRVMIVDDDETIIETLTYNLKRLGFEVTSFKRSLDALSGLEKTAPDLIVIDWMLPDLAGPEVVKLIRERGIEVPILMLTGRSSPNDVAAGLSAGADDYLAKPFSKVEFTARVQALLRRSGKSDTVTGARLRVGDLLLDDEAKRVTLKEKKIDLSPKEFKLLKTLMKNADKTLSTDVLLNKVWGSDYSGDVKTVAVHMRWLRQKLEEDPKKPKLLETVQRSGYRLNSPAGIMTGSEHGE